MYFEVLDSGDHGYYPYTDGVVSYSTGLKDKNEKEIYEGDICRNNEYDLLVVKFGEHHTKVYGDPWSIKDHFGFYFSIYGNEIDDVYIGFSGGYSVEVIGNIYENEDLLK